MELVGGFGDELGGGWLVGGSGVGGVDFGTHGDGIFVEEDHFGCAGARVRAIVVMSFCLMLYVDDSLVWCLSKSKQTDFQNWTSRSSPRGQSRGLRHDVGLDWLSLSLMEGGSSSSSKQVIVKYICCQNTPPREQY